MFDIGFWEVVLVGIVALLVFGPERLPRVVRETALWVRKARSMVASVKQDIDHELQLHELQESLRREKKALTSLTLDDVAHGPGVRAADTQDADRAEGHGEEKHPTGRG